MVVGVFVWGLIGWAALRYRRKAGDTCRAQLRYNLPIEILYTFAPFVIVGCSSSSPRATSHELTKLTDRPRSTRSTSSARSGPGRSTTCKERRGTTTRDADERRRPTSDLPVGRDDPLHPDLTGRHPLLLGPGVPVQDGRHPGPGQQLRADAEQGRARTRAGAPSCAASTTRGCSSTSRSCSEADYDAAPCRPQGARSGRPARRPDGSARRRRRSDPCSKSASDRQPRAGRPSAADRRRPQARAHDRRRWMTTTDHKVIGNLYLDHVVRVLPVRRRAGAGACAPSWPTRACSSSTTSSTTSSSRCTARSCCCCSRPRCSPASPT